MTRTALSARIETRPSATSETVAAKSCARVSFVLPSLFHSTSEGSARNWKNQTSSLRHSRAGRGIRVCDALVLTVSRAPTLPPKA